MVNLNARRLAEACIAGVAVFVTATLWIHIVQPDLSVLGDAVSYYMNGPFGWVLAVGLLVIAAGSFSLCWALKRAVPKAVAGRLALAIWALGTALGGAFPPDPRGSWDKPPSLSGLVHANAAMVALMALPLAALLLSNRIGELSGSSAIRRSLQVLAPSSAALLAVFFASLAPVFFGRSPCLLGLSERALLAAYAAWLSAASLAVRRIRS